MLAGDLDKSRGGTVGSTGGHGYARVGIWSVGEKHKSFLEETLSKLRFFGPSMGLPPYPLPQIPDGRVRHERYGGRDRPSEKSFNCFLSFIDRLAIMPVRCNGRKQYSYIHD
jgi:hypothetical protein